MIDTPKILQTAAQPLPVIHIPVPRAEIQKVMGPGIAELKATLAAQGIVPTGPWLTYHRKMNPDTFDFEIAVPVSQPVADAGRVRNGQLPAATVARTILHGGYEGLPAAWPELDAWIVAQGRTPGPALWE